MINRIGRPPISSGALPLVLGKRGAAHRSHMSNPRARDWKTVERECWGCHQERPMVGNRRYCDECRAAGALKHARKPCPQCGGEKEPGKRKWCKKCQESRMPVWRREGYESSKEKLLARRAMRDAGTPPSRAPRNHRKNAPEGTRWCTTCQQYLPVENFAKNGKKGSSYCKPCYSAYAHDQRLRKVYGITVEIYDQLLALQGGRCAVCLSKPRTRRLAVDHNHETGEVRGLLCTRCNHHVIGQARESTAILSRAIAYLESPPAITGRDPQTYAMWFEARLEAAVEEADAAETAGAPPVAHFRTAEGKALVVMPARVWLEWLKHAADRAA